MFVCVYVLHMTICVTYCKEVMASFSFTVDMHFLVPSTEQSDVYTERLWR